MTARIMLELVDAQDNVIATIPVQGQVAAGILGANGVVTQSTNSVLVAELDEAIIDILYSGARLRSSVAFTTSDQTQHLRILDRYAMELQVTLAVNYVVNGDD